jgi:hypothetical protein
MKWASVLAVLLLAGCAETPTLTPGELNMHADQYDGKHVRVRGWLVYQFEDIGLWDSKEAYGRGFRLDPGTCVSILGFDPPRRVSEPAVVEGVFRKQILPPNLSSNGLCNDTGLEVSKVTTGDKASPHPDEPAIIYSAPGPSSVR